ncbi:restriction endonuclease subunit S [Brachybacterium sp. Marseille-Q2903]|uniref:Restriction endonuclease subunit S n=1 Tax=Brachybacterium epidermidis TaxID=2781983 RepID=A0ABR9W3R3_9MICO|nr:restriction endonuclease subunit S [Brachybacterium epidermidis]
MTAVNPGRLNGVSPDEVIRYVDISSVSWDGGIDVRSLAAMPFGQAPGRARRPINEKDVVVSTVRPRLRAMGQVPPSLAGQVASTGLCVLRPHDPQVILPDYVWQVVRHQPFTDWLVERETGSNYPAVRSSDIEAYRFLLPPIEEQRRIVDLMSHVDDLIALNEFEVSKQHALRSVVLEDGLADAEDGQTRLGDLTASVIGGTWGSPPGEREVEVVSFGTKAFIGEVQYLDPSSGASRSLSATQYAKRELLSGDVVLEVSGGSPTQLVGRTLLVREDLPGVVPSSFMRRIRVNREQALPRYFHLLTQWLYQSGAVEALQPNTTSIRNLKVPLYLDLPVPSLPLHLQADLVERIDAMDDAIESSVSDLTALRSSRTSLLATLLSGEHSIPSSYDEFISDEGAA